MEITLIPKSKANGQSTTRQSIGSKLEGPTESLQKSSLTIFVTGDSIGNEIMLYSP